MASNKKTFIQILWTCGALLVGFPAAAQDTARGEVLYTYCTQCHGEDGAGDVSTGVPNIGGLSAWYVEGQVNKFRDGRRGAHPDDRLGLRMRPMSRSLDSDEDVAAVAAYVASMPVNKPPATIEGDATKGAGTYALCGTCHGANGEGNQAMNGPSLNIAADWYLYTQLANFKSGVRGAAAQDAEGAVMAGMSNVLADDQAIKDVIAHIQTLAQ